jgi:hypothetical protein
MAHKRGNGEGSIYQREVDARWFGSIVVGFDAKGRQKRRTVSAKSCPNSRNCSEIYLTG